MPEIRAPGTYVDEVPTRNMNIIAVPTSVTAFVGGAERGPVGVPVTVRSASEYRMNFGASSGPLASAVELFFMNGGMEAVVLRVARKEANPTRRLAMEALNNRGAAAKGKELASVSPTKGGPAAQVDISCFNSEREGIRALDGVAFNLMYIPPYLDGKGVDIEVLAAAASYCRERRGMLIIDAPREWSDLDAAERGMSGLRGSLGADAKNAMVYFPYLRRGSGTSVKEFPPGPAAAGIIARTDAQRGPWKSPAGLEALVRGADGTVLPIGDADLDRLNSAGMNCIRAMSAAGLVVWGARTLDQQGGGSEWRYIAVRRLALLIEESLVRGLAWTAFEPNGEELWAMVRLSVGSFLGDLHRKGAFQGALPKDAYLVKCDRETTTQSDISIGVVNLTVGFAPLRPAEFIILRVQLRAASPL